MQVLERQLRGVTVLQIAHDLPAVLSYDRIAVMADGAVAEVGPPGLLLSTPGGWLAGLAAAAAGGA